MGHGAWGMEQGAQGKGRRAQGQGRNQFPLLKGARGMFYSWAQGMEQGAWGSGQGAQGMGQGAGKIEVLLDYSKRYNLKK